MPHIIKRFLLAVIETSSFDAAPAPICPYLIWTWHGRGNREDCRLATSHRGRQQERVQSLARTWLGPPTCFHPSNKQRIGIIWNTTGWAWDCWWHVRSVPMEKSTMTMSKALCFKHDSNGTWEKSSLRNFQSRHSLTELFSLAHLVGRHRRLP